MRRNESLKIDLKILLCAVATVTMIGILFVYSASAVYALENHASAYYCVKRHLIGIVIGLIGLLIAAVTPIEIIKQAAPYGFIIGVILTTLTLVPGFANRIHGSSRWLNIKGFSFQPSELLKITMIIYVAYLMDRHYTKTKSMYARMLCIVVLVSILLLKQPDFGMTATICCTVMILLLCSEFPLKHIAAALGITIPIALTLVLLQPYRMKRIMVFINPWNDPHGAGFQIIQSLIAIGSGGLWGLGIGYSKQKFFYLPMQHTDFIFSIIAEETGFIGSCFIIALYALILHRGIKIALDMESRFGFYTVLGIISMISLQSVINIAVATGLAPTKGLGLPFISYGNTALICNLFAIGVIINLVYSRQKKLSPHTQM